MNIEHHITIDSGSTSFIASTGSAIDWVYRIYRPSEVLLGLGRLIHQPSE